MGPFCVSRMPISFVPVSILSRVPIWYPFIRQWRLSAISPEIALSRNSVTKERHPLK
jgi:hypothetical protein